MQAYVAMAGFMQHHPRLQARDKLRRTILFVDMERLLWASAGNSDRPTEDEMDDTAGDWDCYRKEPDHTRVCSIHCQHLVSAIVRVPWQRYLALRMCKILCPPLSSALIESVHVLR